MDPTYPLVPIANFLACILVTLPLSRHTLRTWNLGVHLFVFWLVVQLLFVGVGGVVWRDNTDNVSPIWCDITTHVEVGLNIAGVGCTLAIARWLYNLTRLRTVIPHKKADWSLAIDIILCIGLPVIAMALYYVTQGARFFILEEYGCSVAMVPSFVYYSLISLVPLIISSISLLFYTPRTIWTFYKQYKEVNEFLSTNNATLDRPNYIRLFILSALDIFITLPVVVIITVSLFSDGPVKFWPGWSYIHQDIGRVVQVSAEEWKQSGGFWLNFHMRWNQWIGPFWSIVFFVLFGITKEARMRYRMMFWATMRPFGLERPVEEDVQEEQFVCAQPDLGNRDRSSQDSWDLRESQTLEVDLNNEQLSPNNTRVILSHLEGFEVEVGDSHKEHGADKYHEYVEREKDKPTLI